MMVGIVVSNGVLLIEYTNELRRRGLPCRRRWCAPGAPGCGRFS